MPRVTRVASGFRKALSNLRPGRRHSVRISLLALGLWIPAAKAPCGEFLDPSNTVGLANCFGEVQFDGRFGTIALSRSERFDFRYQFTTFEGAESPLLGRNFFVPLLESKLIDHDHFLEYTTLGGARRFIYRLPADPNQYVSLNGRERARRLGRTNFVRESSDGYVLHYGSGRLENFETPSGTLIELHYDDQGRCRSVTSSSGGTVLAVNDNGDRTRQFTNATGAFTVEMQDYYNPDGESVSDTDGDSDSVDKTAFKVIWPSGEQTSFNYSEPGVTPVQLSLNYASDALKVSWDKKGRIIAAGQVDYDVSRLGRGFDADAERIAAGTWSVTRRWPDGDWKRYAFDEDNGIIDESSRSGDYIRTFLIPNRGPTYNLVRKRVRFPAGGEFLAAEQTEGGETFYEAFYDGQGRLLRELVDGEVYWHLWPDGLDQSIVREQDNFFVYDDSERLTLRRVDQAYTRIQWSPDGSRRIVCRYPWGEVTLRHYGPDGRPAAIPKDDSFPEKGSARVVTAD